MASRCLLLSLVLILALGSSVSGSAWNEEFAQANKFYEARDFSSAIRLYQSIVDGGEESAALYFNLGNAHFKSGDLGRAVLNYTRARRLDPADEDIAANLEFAMRFSSVQMEGVQLNPVNTFMESLIESYRLSQLAWLASAFFILLLVLVALRFGFGLFGPAFRSGIIATLILLVVASALTTYKYRHDYLTRRAVITAQESPVFTGPSENSDIELQGAPGLVVEILDETDGYYSVLFENKRRGWIAIDLVAEI